MEKVFRFFAENYRITYTLVFTVIVFGFLGLSNLSRESRPPVDFARATVSTLYPGSSPEEVEEKVTKKIEEKVRTVSGIKDVVSVSQAGRSEISIRVELDGVDPRQVMDDLQRAVQEVSDLPEGVLDRPTFSRLNSKEIPILELGLMGSNENRRRDLYADQLKESIEDVDGVSSVRLVGFREREFLILLDREKMDRYHVGISELVNAVQRRTQDVPAGYVRTPKEERLVRVRGQVRNIEEVGEITIRANFNGHEIKVKDVAQVKDSEEEASVDALVNGVPATLLIITKRASADAIRTVDEIQEKLDAFKGRMEKGYDIEIYKDEADEIDRRLTIVISNALAGLVLVLVILLIFLPGALGLATSLSLPISILATLGFMAAIGANINNVTMIALVIAVGMLVDNAIVVSENYAQHREDGMGRVDASVLAAHQFWLPISATVLTTVAAFLPMLVTKGIMGQFIRYIPIVVSISLMVSLAEAFFFLPARLRFTVQTTKKKSETKKVDRFERLRVAFEDFMRTAVHHRYRVFFGTGALLIASILLAVFGNRFELFPKEGVESYMARFETDQKSTLENTQRLAMKLAGDIRETLGKEKILHQVIRVGVAQLGLGDSNSKNGPNVGMVIIQIPPKVAADLPTQVALDRLRTIPKGEFTELQFQAAAPGPPVGTAVSVTLRGNSYEKLESMSGKFKGWLTSVKGVADVQDDEVKGGPEYSVDLDFQNMARLGLTTETVGFALRAALQGAIASELNLDNQEFYLRVRYQEADREKIESIRATRIMTPTGNLVPLSAIAKIRESQGPSLRKHYNFLRSITVTADVDPKQITSIEANALARQKIKELLNDYPGVSVKFGGEEESTRESVQSLFRAMMLAILGIFAIMMFLFKSFTKSMLVLSTIPLGLVGVSFSFFLHDKPLGFFALIGTVGLAGVVVNSAIVLMSFVDELKATTTMSLMEILPLASSRRLRAVMATGLTTLGGLFPTAYGIGGYDAVLVPMTLAMAWGLVSGTVLTLIWIPCGYAVVEDFRVYPWREKLFRRWKRDASGRAPVEG